FGSEWNGLQQHRDFGFKHGFDFDKHSAWRRIDLCNSRDKQLILSGKSESMETNRQYTRTTAFFAIVSLAAACSAQVNTGSNGSDGALTPWANIVVDMTDHPNGIYQYTSVNIPSGVTVTFRPNVNNTAVMWLVQANCVINGVVDVSAP